MASAQSRGAGKRYRFADLTLDLGRCCVWRNSEPIPLSKLTFNLLRALAEQAPNVVPHGDLADKTWGPHRVVTPECLAKRVMLLRQALGDEADQPRYVEPVRGQGYRLIPEVEEVAEEDAPDAGLAPAAAPLPAIESHVSRRAAPAWRYAARSRGRVLGVAAALIVAVAGWMICERLKQYAPSPGVRSLAVLPFENRSAAEEDAGFFAQGIHDDLITRLAAISALRVVPRATVTDYCAGPHSRSQIGEELGVDVVLDGSVQRAGDMVRVNVQLVDTRTEETIWGESYDEALTAQNVFAIQRRIATAITQELQAQLTPEEETELNRTPTRNMRALDLYLSGRDYERPPFAYWGMAALQYERAVAEDPQFALAHARLSLANLLAYYSEDWDAKRVEMAKIAAEEAVRLQPDLPIARVAKAFFLLSVKGDVQGATGELAVAAPNVQGEPQFFIVRALLNERLGKRQDALADRATALALSPRDPVLMLDIATWHARAREHEQAKRLVDRALDIRPDFKGAEMFKAELAMLRDGDPAAIRALSLADFTGDPGRRARLWQLKWLAALYDRDFETAIRLLERPRGAERPEDDGGRTGELLLALAARASTLRAAGDAAAAHRLYARGLARIESTEPPSRVWRATFLAGAGKFEEAVRLAREVLEESPVDGTFTNDLRLWALFDVLAPSGAGALAVEVLEEYLSRPGSWSIEGLLPDPRLDPIRSDPHFRVLMAKYRREDGLRIANRFRE